MATEIGPTKEEKTPIEEKKTIDGLTIRDAVEAMIKQVNEEKWQAIASVYPREFQSYFAAKYENIKNNFGTLYNQIIKNDYSTDPIKKQQLDHMFEKLQKVRKDKLDLKEAEFQAMEPLYKKHVYPILEKLEKERLAKKSRK